jgi:chromosome segregation ATPase
MTIWKWIGDALATLIAGGVITATINLVANRKTTKATIEDTQAATLKKRIEAYGTIADGYQEFIVEIRVELQTTRDMVDKQALQINQMQLQINSYLVLINEKNKEIESLKERVRCLEEELEKSNQLTAKVETARENMHENLDIEMDELNK